MANTDSFVESDEENFDGTFDHDNFDGRFDEENRDSSDDQFDYEPRSHSGNDDSENSGDEELAPQQDVDYGPLEVEVRERNQRRRKRARLASDDCSHGETEIATPNPSRSQGIFNHELRQHQRDWQRQRDWDVGARGESSEVGARRGITPACVLGSAREGVGVPASGRRRSNQGIHLYTNPVRKSGRLPPVRMATRSSHSPPVGGSSPAWEDITVLDPRPSASQVRQVLNNVSGLGGEDGVRATVLQPRARRQRIKKNGNWTDSELQQAMAEVDQGVSMRKAAQKYNIPYTTFREWCYGVTTSRRRGAKTVLTAEEEEQIVQYLVHMCELGYGLSPSALRLKVYEITKSRWTPFKNGIPGAGWMRWWKRRHPELTIRASQALESARAQSLCSENVNSFYDNLQQLYDTHAYPPERVWNCDESGAQAGELQNILPYTNSLSSISRRKINFR